jgi:SRSO17 transposase
MPIPSPLRAVSTTNFSHHTTGDGFILQGFRRHGQKSAGVARQYSGTAGTIDHGQFGVFLGYDSPNGRTWLDRELYLPTEWLADSERAQGAGIPVTVTCQTTPPLDQDLLQRALAAGVPATWVTGDVV